VIASFLSSMFAMLRRSKKIEHSMARTVQQAILGCDRR
jgi:hypothetical protein